MSHSFSLLYVEDEPELRELMSMQFEANGAVVSTAANGIEALKLLKSNKFDVVITDLKMPEVDGFGLKRLADIMALEAFPKVWVLLTAHSDALPEETTRLGFNEVFYKPFKPDVLIEYCRGELRK